jgi:hypothetical protein
MSTQEALIEEIKKQPEPVLKELQHYLAFLIEQRSRETTAASSQRGRWPERYFEMTAGALKDEPLERPPQLPCEKREEW